MSHFGRCLVLLLILIAPVAAEVAVPPLKARVTDLTGTLSNDQQRQIESRLQAFEAAKGSQLAILIVPTTQPETIEQYSIRVAEQWKVGRKSVDDGVILVVAKNDRTVRIEVGYGLEGVLTDAMSKRIIEQVLIPQFKQGNFYSGISNTVEYITRAIEGEPLPAPKPKKNIRGNLDSLLFIGFIAVVFLGGLLRNIFGSFISSFMVGGIAGVLAWLIVGPIVVAIIAGVIAFIFNLLSGNRSRWGGWSSGQMGRGGWSGGGGFSGGGGGFGGGGASGRW